jgi:hypothetical protein
MLEEHGAFSSLGFPERDSECFCKFIQFFCRVGIFYAAAADNKRLFLGCDQFDCFF